MGDKTSDITGLYECIHHPDRLNPQRECTSAMRDGIADQICTCCDECRATCLATPHGHGGLPEEEWDRERGICKLCGEDVKRWVS